MVRAIKTKKTETKQNLDFTQIIEKTEEEGANWLVNSFNGFKDMFFPQGPKKGMRFGFISFRKPVKMRKFHRTAKDENGKKIRNPYIDNAFEVGKIRIDLNAIFENCVNNKADRVGEKGAIGFEAEKKRRNGIENYNGSRVVCHKEKDGNETFYLNYIVSEYVGEVEYQTADGKPLDYAEIEEYHQKKSYESKKKQADKHGLKVEDDVQIRQMKFENITNIKIFGKELRFVDKQTAKCTA